MYMVKIEMYLSLKMNLYICVMGVKNNIYFIRIKFYPISKIAFPFFGNRLHITGTKINRQILNTNGNK
jgi:hypothetical protein